MADEDITKPIDTRSQISKADSQTAQDNATTGLKGGVTGDTARPENKYNHNFSGTFCGCGDVYDPAVEKGTMFQCLGLGHTDSGGCGEDWWHPECLVGLPRHANTTNEKQELKKDEAPAESSNATDVADGIPATPTAPEPVDDAPLPSGFPAEDDFDHLLCYKCVEANPWIKQYAGSQGFLPPVHFKSTEEAVKDEQSDTNAETMTGTIANGADSIAPSDQTTSAKRKLDDAETEHDAKRSKVDDDSAEAATQTASEATNGTSRPKHTLLPPTARGRFSVFVKEDFRDHLCRCADCFPRLSKNPQLLEVEDTYEPPVSQSDDDNDEEGQGSVGSKSLLDRGEAALSTMDRMKAIEGVMAYNHLRDKVKAFLQPFAESGQAVGAEDVKAYFARLRGDEDAIRAAASGAGGGGKDEEDTGNRREQSGY
ncbi:hypothetical protein ANO11243_035230 [Dothideomycetidae sp. 11243]|nr:hypothetical protein ANO11243_035230 [fungal sp. No.11243]